MFSRKNKPFKLLFHGPKCLSEMGKQIPTSMGLETVQNSAYLKSLLSADFVYMYSDFEQCFFASVMRHNKLGVKFSGCFLFQMEHVSTFGRVPQQFVT